MTRPGTSRAGAGALLPDADVRFSQRADDSADPRYSGYMIARLAGTLEALDRGSILVNPAFGCGQGQVCYEVLVPAYLLEELRPRLGQPVRIHTIQYLESQGQGASFVPRLIGFTHTRDRELFELFTTVKGLGTRKALKAMTVPPAQIARWIAGADGGALTKLPGVGKRLADTIVAELRGKVDSYLSAEELGELESKPVSHLPPAAIEAIEAMIALGETRPEAERRVLRAIETGVEALTPDQILAAAFGAG